VRTLRIATRGSELALAQARTVALRLHEALGAASELVVIKTSGDRFQDVSLAKIGGKGLFIKEIEEALLAGQAELAVHSAKDLPARIAPGLVLAAYPERADPRDALLGRQRGVALAELASGARVGTGSARRRSLLLAARPDLDVVPLRGNVPTRVAKLDGDSLDAVVLACAGLDRLGLGGRIDERLDTDRLLPAVCQGTLALEARAGSEIALELAALDDEASACAVAAERAFLERLEGDCNVPLAAHAELEGEGAMRVRGLVASSDGERVVRGERRGSRSQAAQLGRALADEVLARGGSEILAALHEEASA